ncbi:hypothetical protein F3J45_05580 [Pantoea sp. Ap-967]|uniref:hypothetical protein n=1 Tax=Pantoea sp. Ap-967 TaxID=2608362 RepID=UPI001422FDC0|nr:hypothetical protein [Pantoea sp. Ap-967]NIE73915.1 hypothetical protein [Pantoea sp. Ap-967]
MCESTGSINIAQRLASQFKFDAPIYLFTLERLLSQNEKAFNLFDQITTEPHTVPGLLEKTKLVLLGAHESTPHCKVSNAIGYLCKQTGTAHASIQHGWIQPGHNFSSTLKRIDYRGTETDNSLSLFHFSKLLSFFGDDGIGYPYPNSTVRKLSSNAIHNIIIATNFNWGVYSKHQIVSFIYAIKEIRAKYPQSTMIHRPHPAEKKEQINQDWAEAYKQCNIKCTSEHPESLELDWASLVISTPSTIALDYITTNTPTALYAPEPFASFTHELSLNSRVFTNANEVIQATDYALNNTTHKIPKFPNRKFRAKIEDLIKLNEPFRLTEDIFFRFGELIK